MSLADVTFPTRTMDNISDPTCNSNPKSFAIPRDRLLWNL